ncbi:helix-turn-helix domain-containing protein [Leeuwenhoekiella polynyae]|uniref:helix-turn-helix domain-containing protein n=1 Tax=Leeuwenhoekiella polynyae TaxID=1550906 RepID=UPI0013E8DC82|nr:helix-turn-helix transcriptional regulator [Leeuwenhoekiella polynyae]
MKFKELRKKKDFSQEQMAEYLGLSPSAYQSQEYETAKPRGTLVKLTRLLFWKELNIPREEILNELRLNDLVEEQPAEYAEKLARLEFLEGELKKSNEREEIYQMTIRALQDRQPNKE